ncbi:MAG TPA: methyltransferase domain-containing protein [Gaiellaceae bacterium]|nr:methyltransferase domain-containing protein [Gaiellaceae bacterium]
MIGWLYDVMGRRVEKGELGAKRHELVAGLEGEVLEIGAGTGFNLPHYEKASRVVAIEPDPSMARRLPRRAAEATVPVEVVSGSAESLPFPDESFDTAVVTFVFCSVNDPSAALADVRRVLKPGGRLVLLEHVRGDDRLARWQERLTPLHRRLAGNCHLNRDTRGAVAAAGFDVTDLRPTRIPGSHPLVRSGLQGVAIKTSS